MRWSQWHGRAETVASSSCAEHRQGGGRQGSEEHGEEGVPSPSVGARIITLREGLQQVSLRNLDDPLALYVVFGKGSGLTSPCPETVIQVI